MWASACAEMSRKGYDPVVIREPTVTTANRNNANHGKSQLWLSLKRELSPTTTERGASSLGVKTEGKPPTRRNDPRVIVTRYKAKAALKRRDGFSGHRLRTRGEKRVKSHLNVSFIEHHEPVQVQDLPQITLINDVACRVVGRRQPHCFCSLLLHGRPNTCSRHEKYVSPCIPELEGCAFHSSPVKGAGRLWDLLHGESPELDGCALNSSHVKETVVTSPEDTVLCMFSLHSWSAMGMQRSTLQSWNPNCVCPSDIRNDEEGKERTRGLGGIRENWRRARKGERAFFSSILSSRPPWSH